MGHYAVARCPLTWFLRMGLRHTFRWWTLAFEDCALHTATILSFRAESDDITVVARMISDALFGGILFSPCTSGRMGAFPALQLDRNILGLSVYVVHMNSRDPREFTLELECDHHPDPPLLSDFIAQRLRAIPEINVST